MAKAKNGSNPDGENTARAGTPGVVLRPASNGGAIAMAWQPGQSGNPGGRPQAMKDVRGYCRKMSMESALALGRIVTDVIVEEDGRVRNREDGRIVVVAAQTLLTWAFGKPPDYDPREDRPSIALDTTALSNDQRATLIAALRGGLLRQADQEKSEPNRQPVDIVGE